MKKLLLSATACLTMAVSSNAQEIQPCGTYQAREIYLKNVPGYAAKLNAAEAVTNAEYQAFLQNASAAKTMSVDPTFTVPVVFHILHLGEAPGTGSNIDDQLCIDALAQVNRDYARQGADTSTIDPLFEPLYENSHMEFMLARKDPYGNCTNGIVHHYDPKTNWSQADLFNYQYSTMAAGNWNPSRYLNVYIVKNIIGGSIGIIVGYTHLPGTAPIDPSDAIVYRNDFLSGLDARSLSHEIGHWFGLSHTFGSTNEPGLECGNDDIFDTPKTTGFFSTCPKTGNFFTAPSVTTPADSSDIVSVSFGPKMRNISSLNSLTGYFRKPIISLTGTVTTTATDSLFVTAAGVIGGYSDFSSIYGNDFNAGSVNSVSIQSIASYSVGNNIGVYIDYNRNGSFLDAGEAVYVPSTSLFGTQTFTTSITLPAGLKAPVRMRVITSDSPVTGPNMTPASGEVEDYILNVGLPSCDDLRPNIENIMDYSSCPKMFTHGQTLKVRQSAQSGVAYRSTLISNDNLAFTGIVNRSVVTYTQATAPFTYTAYVYTPVSASPCAPIADFAANKLSSCAGQAVTYNSTSYNSTPTSYSWVFEGGTPATSTLATQSVTYSTPGSYSVSLTVSNANGTSTKTVGSYFTTNWNAANVTLPYSEDFESGQWWPAGWVNVNSDFGTHSWEMSNYGAGTLGNDKHSLVLPNANYITNFPGSAGNVDVMETPSFDFSNVTNPSISFDYSFARKTAVTADTFKLQYSLDCGGSWKNVPSVPTTASLVATTGGTVNAPYFPWSSATSSVTANPKWKTVSVSNALIASALNNKRDVKFRFWFINDIENGESQNMYIDNINISGTVGVHEFENSIELSIYPNPTNSASTVEFTSPNNSKVNILVYDVTGRVVEHNELNANAGVTNKHSVNASGKLTAGIYFISLTIDNNKVVKKLIIN